MKRYNPKDIEPKWQKIWDESGTYTANLASDKPKYIAMSMFNYPSGAGIHIGHAMNYTISDVKARFKRQQGYESYHPVGWDAFGLPAENYAIKSGVSPQQSMAGIIPMYHKQYKAMGWSNDWEEEIATHLPEYYRWTQWIFAEMYRHGLAYQDSRMQWWCSIDNTVLANEQVIDGKCWRHDAPEDPLVEKREVKQWFFKITDYADELLEATDALDWTESVKLAQKNWIGKSVGAEVDFEVERDVKGQDFLFLHAFQDDSRSVFWPWLKEKLESRGAKVTVLDLPNSAKPNLAEQMDYVLEHYTFTEQTVMVCHSLGGVLALKLLPTLDTKIEKLILAGTPIRTTDFKDGKRRPELDNYCDWQFDFDGVKQHVKQTISLSSTNDHVVPLAHGEELAKQLGATFESAKTSEPHFNGTQEAVVLHNILPAITVFTTRPDTIFGATSLVLAPEHELVSQITTLAQKAEVESYVKEAEKKSEVERQAEREKTGVPTGAYAINPANGERIPIWIADYVLVGYGTGAIMAVPAHDERDNEFAKKFDLSIVRVVKNDAPDGECTYDEGVMMNSGEYDGLPSGEAREKIVRDLAAKDTAQEKVNYKMRDWSVSRQRYWGAPIPIINCPKCGPVLVPDEDLPVVLPELDDFQPSGDGRSALARAKDWLVVDCPKCGGRAERETDTLDTYIDSSWYMYRYFDPHNQEKIFDEQLVKKWEPIDFYNGADHATAHLLYARFIGHFFKKIGLVDEPEPFKQFLFNGKVTAADGTMFSKSKGNGVDPLEIIGQGYGADALRTYLMFAAPLDLWVRWDSQGVPGTYRFLNRLWNIVQSFLESNDEENHAIDEQEWQAANLNYYTHSMLKKVTEDIEENRYNTAIAALMQCLNALYKIKEQYGFGERADWQAALENIVACVAPFAPHIAEELWHELGHSTSVHIDTWPSYDEKYLVNDTMTIVVQINGKLRAQVELPAGADEGQVVEAAKTNEKVAGQLAGKEVAKTIYVPKKLVNFVVPA